MKTRTLVVALALGACCGASATAQELPRFDIEATCRSAQALTAEDRDPVQGCLRDEADAERQLRTIWGSTAAAQRETCAAESQVGGFPSYVEVLTCLQLAQGVAPAPRNRR
jgi:hypothetical protein